MKKELIFIKDLKIGDKFSLMSEDTPDRIVTKIFTGEEEELSPLQKIIAKNTGLFLVAHLVTKKETFFHQSTKSLPPDAPALLVESSLMCWKFTETSNQGTSLDAFKSFLGVNKRWR